MFHIKEVILEEEKLVLTDFLNKYDLDYELDIDYSILVYYEEKLIATASLANNVMKCFLVATDFIGQNVTGLMFSHLVNVLMQKGISHYFVFTTPSNEKVFNSLNMKSLVKTMNTVLLEGGDSIDNVLGNLKKEFGLGNGKKSCVIINANPMTLGHMYLIETASKESDEVLVFVVSEDLSSFPFSDRFEIIKEACSQFSNVTVLPTLSYLVSKITFPKYFLKEDQLIQDEQTLVDVMIYKEYYTRIFNIKKRYLGEEPLSYNTNKYNKVLKDYLNGNIKIIERKKEGSKVISASLVRKLIKANKISRIKKYVPLATYNYLLSEKGQAIISKIQETELGRH